MDAEYARDLGYAAVRHLVEDGTPALVTVEGGGLHPIPLAGLLEGPAGAGRRRAVDVTTESYQVARRYMVRLESRDFADADWVAKLAAAGGLSADAFRGHFARLG
jgi:6-phosphofructokinase 1